MFKKVYFYLKKRNKNLVILVNCGKFYRTLGDDAYVVHEILKYKIHDELLGFPDNVLDNVIARLNNVKIGCVVCYPNSKIVKYDVVDSNYNRYLQMAKLFFEIESKESFLHTLIHMCLVKDISNYEKIKDFLNDL